MDGKFKAITHIPGWAEMLEVGDKVSTPERSYDLVPLIYRATKLRCNSLSSVPMHFYQGEREVEWAFDTSLEKLLWATEAALLLTGGAYWLKAANQIIVKDVVWLNPMSMEVEYRAGEGFNFTQRAGSQVNDFTQDEIVYFREFDIKQDTHPGTHDAGVALSDSQLQHYMTRFAWHFFEGGAMPVTVLGMEQVSDTELKRVEGKFQKLMGGIKNAFKILGVRADAIDIKTITPPLKDLTMPALYGQSKKNIANAFGIPVTMLEDPSANRATAMVHHYSFWSETVRPRGKFYEDIINNQLLAPGGITMKFAFEEMDIFQEDENARANSLNTLVTAGIPLLIAMEILGYDLSIEAQKKLEQMLAEKAQRADALTQQFTQGNDDDDSKGYRAELSLWKKNAVKRLKSGRNPARIFQGSFIPEDVSKRIYTLLRMSKSVDEIVGVFDKFMALDNIESPDVGELVDALRAATIELRDNERTR